MGREGPRGSCQRIRVCGLGFFFVFLSADVGLLGQSWGGGEEGKGRVCELRVGGALKEVWLDVEVVDTYVDWGGGAGVLRFW